MIDELLCIVSDLTYRNYCHNRKMSPDVSPERWEKMYGASAPAMEIRFQEEKSMNAALGGFPDVNTSRAHYAGNE